MSDLLNTRIDRYEIRERIGSGGMARVFKAWDTKLERLVAIKLLHEHLADDPTFKSRFEREAKVVAAFDHPNIVRIFDYNVVDRDGAPLYYMVMSYVPGKTLRQVLEEGAASGERLPQARVMRLVDHITDALDYAHARGMAHRDVKPGNILINEDGAAILTDFGIARLVQSTRLTQDGVSTGTPAYMSPEQAAGEAGDTRSDLYSLAVIVFEMLAGQVPFPDEGSLSVMLKHINAPIPKLSEVNGQRNAKLDLFIEKALAKTPAERFQTARAFQTAFKRVFRDDVMTAEIFAFDGGAEDRPTTVVFSPAPATGTTPAATPLPPSSPSLTQSTSIVRTISERVREHPRASSGFFILVGALVVVLIVTTLLSGRDAGSAASTIATQEAAARPAETDNQPFRSRFDGRDASDDLWPQTAQGPSTQLITDGVYRLTNETRNNASTAIYAGGTEYMDVLIAMEAVIDAESGPTAALGIIFRYQDNNNYNVFTIDGEGRYSIWTLEDGNWTELGCQCRGDRARQWTTDSRIRPLGESNRLSISVVGDRLTGYVNEGKVVEVEDSTFGSGAVGVYLGTPPDGMAAADIDLFTVSDSVPSMTGE